MTMQALFILIIYLLVGGLLVLGLNWLLGKIELPQPVRWVANILLVILIFWFVFRQAGLI